MERLSPHALQMKLAKRVVLAFNIIMPKLCKFAKFSGRHVIGDENGAHLTCQNYARCPVSVASMYATFSLNFCCRQVQRQACVPFFCLNSAAIDALHVGLY